jgi:hypothetical protein
MTIPTGKIGTILPPDAMDGHGDADADADADAALLRALSASRISVDKARRRCWVLRAACCVL